MGASAVPRKLPAPPTPIRGLLERSKRRKEPPYGKRPEVPHVCAANGQRPHSPKTGASLHTSCLPWTAKGTSLIF